VHIETPRLVVTMPGPAQAGRVVDYFERNHEHLARWEPIRSAEFYTERFWQVQLEESRRELAEDRSLRLVLFPKNDDGWPVIGVVNFTGVIRGAFHACLLGYSIDLAREGQGLMHEALRASIDYVFTELRLHRIMANYQPTNHRSAQLLRRLGFVTEGYAQRYLYIDGGWRDHVLTALTNPRWQPPR
jgi:ribosomal-protein-alanine N-acetyltransferase